jgi:transcription elongation factor Elf1
MCMMKFACPTCGHGYQDELEVLNEGEMHDFKCENCSNPFHVLIKECLKCTADTVFVWPEKPTWEAVSVLACSSCGTPYLEPDELNEQDL